MSFCLLQKKDFTMTTEYSTRTKSFLFQVILDKYIKEQHKKEEGVICSNLHLPT